MTKKTYFVMAINPFFFFLFEENHGHQLQCAN